MQENEKHSVPGRISLEQLHKEQDELRVAKKEMEKIPESKKVLNAMSFFSVGMDFAIMIALPLIALVFLGKWADSRMGTKYFVIIGILLALAISCAGIYKQIKILQEQLKNKK